MRTAKSRRLIGNTLDITEQEESTQELQRREAYLAEAQRLSHTGSFGWDIYNRRDLWSDETFRIFGYEPTVNRAGLNNAKRVHPDDRSLVEETIEKVKKGASVDFEHRFLMPDGSVKHVHVIGRRLTINSTNDVEVVGTVMDITTRKKAFEEIKALRDELYNREHRVARGAQ